MKRLLTVTTLMLGASFVYWVGWEASNKQPSEEITKKYPEKRSDSTKKVTVASAKDLKIVNESQHKGLDRELADIRETKEIVNFKPNRRIVDHPEFGLIVQLVYPKNVVRYELPGATDHETTHEYEENVQYDAGL